MTYFSDLDVAPVFQRFECAQCVCQTMVDVPHGHSLAPLPKGWVIVEVAGEESSRVLCCDIECAVWYLEARDKRERRA